MAKKDLKPLKNAAVGTRAVVNGLPDGTVYTIEAMANGIAELTYKLGNGQIASGGQYPVSCLYEPTKEQLAAA